jgi:hypothetical protein
MYSYYDRIRAVKLCIKFGKRKQGCASCAG